MISEQKFNETYEEFKNIAGKERLNKDKDSFIIAFKTLKSLICIISPECEAVEEIDKLFNKFEKDGDLYNFLKSIPDKYKFLNIPDDYYINMYYEKMKEEINKRRK